MAEKTQRDIRSVAHRRMPGCPPDLLLARRWAWALVVGLVALASLLAVYRVAPLARLPDYPAVILALLIAVILPGLILQRVVLTGNDVDFAVRLAVAPALGMALVAVPGVVALELHLDLQAFATMHACLVGAACGLSLLFSAGGWVLSCGETDSCGQPNGGGDGGSLLLVAMVGIVLAGVLTMPFWASGRVEGDRDDWTYMAYVREYLDTDRMNAEEPFLGTGDPVNPRMRANVWVVVQALIADVAGVPPHDLLLEYLPPLLTVLAVLATYALTRSLFRGLVVGLLAAAFQLGYAFLDFAPHEGFGRDLFLRISEDKMVAAFVLFPIALVFLSRFAANASAAAFVGFALVVLGLMVVHPVPLVFLAAAIVSLGVLRAWVQAAPKGLWTLAWLLVPVGLGSVWPFVQRQLLADVAPHLFSTRASAITFRDEFHIVELGGGLIVGNYHMILHPMVIASLVMALLVWLSSRRQIGNQLVMAMTLGALLLFFVPLLATPLAEVMTPQTLWKVPWMVPVAPILAYVAYQAARRLVRTGLSRLLGPRLTAGVAPAAVCVALLAGALVVQEQYLRIDGGAFYDWTSGSSLVPGSDGSIFLGGLDRAFSGTWRLTSHEEQLLTHMGESFPRGSVVLMEPSWPNQALPGILTDIYPVDFGGLAGEGERRDDAAAFARGALSEVELEAVVRRYGVDYIVTREVEAANESVRSFSRAQWLAEIGPYEVYQIVP